MERAVYRVWCDNPSTKTHDFVHDEIFSGPLEAWRSLEALYEFAEEDTEFTLVWIYFNFNLENVMASKFASEVMEKTGCTEAEALDAIEKRRGVVPLAIEYLKNKDLAEMVGEDEAYPSWTNFKNWLVKNNRPINPEPVEQAGWADL